MAEDNDSRISQLEKDMHFVKTELSGLNRTIFGIDGEGGMLRKFDAFVTKWTTREEDKKSYDDRQEKQQQKIMADLTALRDAKRLEVEQETLTDGKKNNKRTLLIALVTAACAIIGTLLAVLAAEHATQHSLIQHIEQSAIFEAHVTEDATAK